MSDPTPQSWHDYLKSLPSAVEVEVAQLRHRYPDSFRELRVEGVLPFALPFPAAA